MAQMQGAPGDTGGNQQISFQKLTNMAGAAISLALVVGIGVWGYKILVRDVSGVPVVRAAEGPMRIQPEDPGGATAEHQGLAVNDVAADGSAARPADRLVLAPEPLTLSLEDTPQSELRVAAPAEETEPVTQEVTPNAEAQDAVESDEDAATLAALNALADELSEGVEPMAPLAPNDDSETDAETKPASETDAAPEVRTSDARPTEGLGRSLRPKARPAQVASVEDAVAASVAAQVATAPEVDPENIPVGTRMAQLGAFESAAVAEQEWAKMSKQFSEYLDDKQRVIQKAQSGGRTFYRLRAMGFGDLSDARRFCSALVAEKADCIPVVTR